MKNKWKLITGIALMSPPIIAMLYLIVMATIKSGTFLVVVSTIGIMTAFLIGAVLCFSAIWLEDNDET